MSRIKIVIDDKIPFIKGVLEAYADVSYASGFECAREARQADALIIRTRTRCDEASLQNASVKFIATSTIGFDHIDAEWCENNNITWVNAPGCNAGSVRQYMAAVLATLAARRNLHFSGTTLGVVGAGNVGGKVAQLGRELGMNVLLNDPPRARKEGGDAFVTLEEILGQSDIVSLHVPLNRTGEDRTFHLFDEAMLRKMRPGAILVNSSRGEVVKNDALKNALKNERPNAAVLDVWEREPDVDRELLPLLELATPHIAGYSTDGKANGIAMSVQALSRFFQLPPENWRPANLPAPRQPLRFKLDGYGKTQQQCICEAILHTYPIEDDDRRLRESPETFEKQRGDYPVRREFEAYAVEAKNVSPETQRQLKALGFHLDYLESI
ncbi:MAG: 4-phosphoerythronate dehydrogenase [Bacteroidales bacterium]|jgi:erythronate-4-phosphate dehydrogenase|nr:4-phosphoerythronate dehydrogenase [Bacteroidales bacterium]